MLNTCQRRKLRTRKNVKLNNKSSRPRIVVNRSNKNIYAQIIDKKGRVLLQASSVSLDYKGSGIEKAKMVARNLCEKCINEKIDLLVFDKGEYNYDGRIKALAEMCRELGLKF